MKDLAILVDNKNDSTEAQDLLFSMGYKWRGLGEISKSYFYPRMNKYFIFMNKNEMDLQMAGYFAGSSRSYAESRFKEITLPELRDMVVLKRNDVGDATHTDGRYSFYVGKDKNYFFSSCDKAWRGTWKNVEILKPIEKPMKEYLRKNSNGTYSYIGTVRPEHVSDFMIEIPKTAELVLRNKQGKIEFFKDKCGSKFENGNWIGVSIPFARLQEGRILFLKGGCQAYWDSDFSKTLAAPFNLIEKPMKEYLDPENGYKLNLTDRPFFDWIEIPEGAESFNYFGNEGNVFFLKNNSEITLYSNETEDWAWQDWGDIDFDGVVCLWKRETLNDQAASADQHTHPEELPFIDDEPSLNDQYAEIETVRQTLKTRQSQYGSFEDVAMITEQMVDIMRKGYYENLAYNQKMALYMICSKMARIVNGNPNHKDSWHDIAGYATLIDNELVSEKDMPF